MTIKRNEKDSEEVKALQREEVIYCSPEVRVLFPFFQHEMFYFLVKATKYCENRYIITVSHVCRKRLKP